MRITRSQAVKFACIEPAPSASPPLTLTKGFMLTLEQQQHLVQSHVYARLDKFIHSHCLKQELYDWMARSQSARPLWNALWPKVRALSERDRALALVFVAVCACEGIALPPDDQLITHLSMQEAKIKRFLEDRGYFHFSDFESIGQSAPRSEAVA